MSTLFFSGAPPRKLVSACRNFNIGLTPRGQLVFGGEIVGRYELARSILVVSGFEYELVRSVLVVRDIEKDSPLIELLDLRALVDLAQA